MHTPEAPRPQPVYLGDAVYIEPGSYAGEFVIYITDGRRRRHPIVLDPYVTEALYAYLDQSRRALRDDAPEKE